MKGTPKVLIGPEGSIGDRLNAWRKSQSMTLIELGKLIDVSQGSLSELENEKSLPSAGTLRSLCLKTNLNLYWLLTGEGDMKRDMASSQPGSASEFILVERDHKLRDLVKCLIRIFKYGGSEKNAHLYGFLHGADPGEKGAHRYGVLHVTDPGEKT